MVKRQFFNEAARDTACPLAINPAVGGMDDSAFTFGAGYCDISEAALFLQRGKAAFIQCALRRENAFLPPD